MRINSFRPIPRKFRGSYHIPLCHFRGLHYAVVLNELCQQYENYRREDMLFSHPKHGSGFFPMSIHLVTFRCGLNRKQQENVFAKIYNDKLAVMECMGPSRSRHFKLNETAILQFFEKLEELYEEMMQLPCNSQAAEEAKREYKESYGPRKWAGLPEKHLLEEGMPKQLGMPTYEDLSERSETSYLQPHPQFSQEEPSYLHVYPQSMSRQQTLQVPSGLSENQKEVPHKGCTSVVPPSVQSISLLSFLVNREIFTPPPLGGQGGSFFPLFLILLLPFFSSY